jgi:4-hydroxy-3-methylbut-2-en-1-yl diphosphate synthase IspG/GcpE
MTTFDINSLTLSQKRDLVKSLKQIIKDEVTANKVARLSVKANKEAEKKAKIEAQIKAAQDKLARLTAKLAS